MATNVQSKKYVFLNNRGVHWLKEGHYDRALVHFQSALGEVRMEVEHLRSKVSSTMKTLSSCSSSTAKEQRIMGVAEEPHRQEAMNTIILLEQEATIAASFFSRIPPQQAPRTRTAQQQSHGAQRPPTNGILCRPFVARQAVLLQRNPRTTRVQNDLIVILYNYGLVFQVMHESAIINEEDRDDIIRFSRHRAIHFYSLSLKLVAKQQQQQKALQRQQQQQQNALPQGSPALPLLQMSLYNNLGVLHAQVGHADISRSILTQLARTLVHIPLSRKQHDLFVSNIRLFDPESLLASAA